MSVLELLLVSLGLSMDAFAVSMAAGIHRHIRGFRPAFRLWFHFGLFQCLMTVFGWFLGARLGGVVAAWDHWVAFALLSVVGGKMIQEGQHPPETGDESVADKPKTDLSRGFSLLSLSIGTSLDAMAVGVSLGMMDIAIWESSVVIGLVTALLSLIGLRIGRFLGAKFGKRMEVVGGIVLLLIALKLLIAGIGDAR